MHGKEFLTGVRFTMVTLGLCVSLFLLTCNLVESSVGFTIFNIIYDLRS